MKRNRKRKQPGLVPGSVIFTGEQRLEKAEINVLRYNLEEIEEFRITDRFEGEIESEKVTWVDVRGVHDVDVLARIGNRLSIHPLILEDIADTHQRPKFEEYDQGYFVILRAYRFSESDGSIEQEQVSLYVKDNLVLSFQEDARDVFTGVRDRLLNNKGRIRNRSSDYLCYALMDNVIDYYFHILDKVEEVIDDLESEISDQPSHLTKSRIHKLRRELLTLRKGISPLREAVSRFMKSEHPSVNQNTWLFMRDLYDHTVQSMEMVETYRDTLSGMQDLYLSEISFRMNSVMQVLTIISTIFIPLTFLAGVYGMNFDYIPELHYRYGYFILLGVMVLIALILLRLFRKKNWL